jgi:hypothetical protein
MPMHLGVSTAGSSLIHQVTATLTDAQIKAISGGSTHYQLVAAPGATRMFQPIIWIARRNFTAGYSNITAADAFFGLDTVWLASNGMANADFSTFFGSTGIQILRGSAPISIVVGGASPGAPYPVGDGTLNAPLNIQIYNGAGALTGGHTANTLMVTVLYATLDATTGVFV